MSYMVEHQTIPLIAHPQLTADPKDVGIVHFIPTSLIEVDTSRKIHTIVHT